MKAGRGAHDRGAAGGPAQHIPVLLEEVIHALQPLQDGLYLDGTFGAGGYTRALLSTEGARVVATDRDPEAIAAGADLAVGHPGRLILVRARFSEIVREAQRLGFQEGAFEGIVFDLGVSSMQLDQASRGFSFRQDGPLDMRMSQEGRSAADIVNEESEEALADLIFQFGEERASRRIARAIVAARAIAPFATTRRLAETIARAAPAKPTQIHPATRTFQALRIAVNDELGEIQAALVSAERLLKPGGRLCVVSFHSLEDRIVKQFFASRAGLGRARSRLLPGEQAPPEPTFGLAGRQPVVAGAAEVDRNPRARSAKLRVGERTAAPPRGLDAETERSDALFTATARER